MGALCCFLTSVNWRRQVAACAHLQFGKVHKGLWRSTLVAVKIVLVGSLQVTLVWLSSYSVKNDSPCLWLVADVG